MAAFIWTVIPPEGIPIHMVVVDADVTTRENVVHIVDVVWRAKVYLYLE